MQSSVTKRECPPRHFLNKTCEGDKRTEKTADVHLSLVILLLVMVRGMVGHN